MKQTDLAYMAGFIDADGSITIVSAHSQGSPLRYRAKLAAHKAAMQQT
jgi:ABC-type cobalamin transport system ATPase subunit